MMAPTGPAYSSSPVSEPAAVGELDQDVVDGVHHLGDRELQLGLDVDHDQRGAVVVGLEAALADLPEQDGEQPVRDVPGLRDPVGERDVEDRLDHAAPAATTPTVSRSPARVDRRMIAQASCPWTAAMASRAEASWATRSWTEPGLSPGAAGKVSATQPRSTTLPGGGYGAGG